MRILATLKNFTSQAGKRVITRNLNRILDIVILDMDVENSTITFLHGSKSALEKAKRELRCIGFPIEQIQILNERKPSVDETRFLV